MGLDAGKSLDLLFHCPSAAPHWATLSLRYSHFHLRHALGGVHQCVGQSHARLSDRGATKC